VGEILYARDGRHQDNHPGDSSLARWYLGPFEAGAHIRDLNRFVQNDPRPPGWPDSEFLGSLGQRPGFEFERAMLSDRSVQREAIQRKLAP